VCACAAVPASASAAATGWKLVSVRGEVRLTLEDRRPPPADCDDEWVASGDYRTVLTSRHAIFGRGYGVYNGSFGSVIGGFQIDFRIHREGSERVIGATTVTDPDTGEESCVQAERTCSGSSEKRSRGSSGLGFGPRRRGQRLGPVAVGFSGHWSFHSCDRRAPDPLERLEAVRGRPGSELMPNVRAVLRLSRFRTARTRIVMQGSAPLREPFRTVEGLDARVSWRFVWVLRRTVIPFEGCIEVGRPSGFVCEPVG
jgi:hypothetical protein